MPGGQGRIEYFEKPHIRAEHGKLFGSGVDNAQSEVVQSWVATLKSGFS